MTIERRWGLKQGNRILIEFILAPNHHPEPLTHHPEPVEGLSPLGVARGDEMDKNGPIILSLSKD